MIDDAGAGCLDEGTVVAFVSGGLQAAALARVEQHLDSCEDCLGLVAVAVHVALESGSSSAGDSEARRREFGSGQLEATLLAHGTDPRLAAAQRRVGSVLREKYRLESVLGVGGMAAVYAATHRNRAEYAIKVLLPEYSSNPDVRRRFLREGYAANSVKHPGAVAVIDDDVAEDGSAFLVLERLDGIPCNVLRSRVDGRFPSDCAVSIALQTLEVLAAAHARGIVHRDIKPANLFVLRDGTVKVLDFGVARMRETLTDPFSTASGVVLGTPAFMAPEQALRGRSDVDGRADIWAMGATLFYLLSGSTVRSGDSPGQYLASLLTMPARSLALAAPDTPPELVAVVDRALRLQRELRWKSADDMRLALLDVSPGIWREAPSRDCLAALVAQLSPIAESTSVAWAASADAAIPGPPSPPAAAVEASGSSASQQGLEGPDVPIPPRGTASLSSKLAFSVPVALVLALVVVVLIQRLEQGQPTPVPSSGAPMTTAMAVQPAPPAPAAASVKSHGAASEGGHMDVLPARPAADAADAAAPAALQPPRAPPTRPRVKARPLRPRPPKPAPKPDLGI